MKTYTIEVSGEKALAILENERKTLAARVAALDLRISSIRRDMEGGGEPMTATNGHSTTASYTGLIARLDKVTDHLGNYMDARIKKTDTGRSTKGSTETSIVEFLKNPSIRETTAMAIAKALQANYSTVYRSLKRLEGDHLVKFDGSFWIATNKLKETVPS